MKNKHLIFLLILTSLITISCKSEKKKIACVGDSITEGYGLANQSISAYPTVLNKILGNEYSVLNCGRSATTLSKTGDFPYWIAKEFNCVFAYEPDIITIKLGTNDTKPNNWNKEEFKKSYQQMIDTFQTIQSKPKIYLCFPVPVFKTVWGINDSTVVNGVIPAIEEIAQKNNLKIIDLYNPLLEYGSHFPDSIHPNEEAEKYMAQIFANFILNNN